MVAASILPEFLLAVFLVTIAPGPDNTYIAAVALARGTRAGLESAVGMSLGMVVHVCAAAFGLAALLSTTPNALIAIRLLGAAYLAWLAWSTLRSVGRGAVAGRARGDGSVLARAVLTNLTNPKVIIFFAAFLPQFTRPGHGPVVLQLLILGLLFLLVGLFCDCLIGLSAGHLGGALGSTARTARALSVLAGLTFAGMAAALLVEGLGGRTTGPGIISQN